MIPISISWAKTLRVLEYGSEFKIDCVLAVFNIIIYHLKGNLLF